MEPILPKFNTPALAELSDREQWICWKLQEVPGKKSTKIPWTPYGTGASTMDAKQWASYQECATEVEQQKFKVKHKGLTGVGFVFCEDDPYVGIDLDHCRDPETKSIDSWAMDIIREVDSYTEVSPSGTGVHMICRGDRMDTGHNKKNQSPEMYTWGRYFTFTGLHLEGTPDEIFDRTDQVKRIEKQYFGYNVKSVVGDESIDDKAFGLDDMRIMTTDEIQDLCDDSDLFRDTWNHKREGFDEDMSKYDAALAVQMIQLNKTPKQVAEVIVAHRHRVYYGKGAGYEKAFRIDYIRRTYFYALQCVKSRSDGDEAEVRDIISRGGQEAIAELAQKMGVSITSVIKRGSAPSKYYILWHATEICIGTAKEMLVQDNVKAALFDVTGAMIKHMSRKKWELLVELIGSCAVFEELEGAGETDEIELLVSDYVEERGVGEKDWKDAASMSKPFQYKGRTYLSLNNFRGYLTLSADYRIKPRDLSYRLKSAGFKPDKVQCKDSRGQNVNKRYWSRKMPPVKIPDTVNELTEQNSPG